MTRLFYSIFNLFKLWKWRPSISTLILSLCVVFVVLPEHGILAQSTADYETDIGYGFTHTVNNPSGYLKMETKLFNLSDPKFVGESILSSSITHFSGVTPTVTEEEHKNKDDYLIFEDGNSVKLEIRVPISSLTGVSESDNMAGCLYNVFNTLPGNKDFKKLFKITYAGENVSFEVDTINPGFIPLLTGQYNQEMIIKATITPKANPVATNGSDIIGNILKITTNGTGLFGKDGFNSDCGGKLMPKKSLLINTATIGSGSETKVLGTAVSPQIPWMILHDPPGDKSYSFFEKNKKICRTTELQFAKEDQAGGFGSVKVGAKGEIGASFIIESTVEFETYNETTISGASGSGRTLNDVHETCIEFNSRYETSAYDPILGDQGDVFIGLGTTYNYGVSGGTTVINTAGNKVVKTTGGEVIFSPTGSTQFVLTERDIEKDIVIQEEVAMTGPDAKSKSIAKSQAEVWRSILKKNKENKEAAQTSTDFQNENFSAGTVIETTVTATTSEVHSLEYNTFFEAEVSNETKLEVAGSGIGGGFFVKTNTTRGTTNTDASDESEAIGYHLEDDDETTDRFVVRVRKDPDFGTPVFLLQENSVTSCPYEGGEPANKPAIAALSQMTKLEPTRVEKEDEITYNKWPGSTMKVPIKICNLSLKERKYELKLVPSTNINNAIVTMGGATLSSANTLEFTVPAAKLIPNTTTVTKTCDHDNDQDYPILSITQPVNDTTTVEFKDLELVLARCNNDFSDTLKITALFDALNPEYDEDMDGVKNGDDTCPEFANRGLDFDGDDDYVDLGTTLGNFGANDFSIEFWMKAPESFAPSITKTIISKRECGEDNYWSVYTDYSGKIFFKAGFNGLSSEIRTSTKVADGKWHHIVVTREGRNGRIWVDGVPASRAAVLSSQMDINNNAQLQLGKNVCSVSTDKYYKGVLDELRIYNKTLTPTEIKANKDKEIDPKISGLVAYYNFESGLPNEDNQSFTQLKDLTENNSNGVLRELLLVGTSSNWTIGSPVISYDSDGDGIGDNCKLAPAAPLNIDWLAFSAELNKHNKTELIWEVANQLNADYYSIEYSQAGQKWVTIGEVIAKDGSNEALTYRFIDNQPSSGLNYYRIRLVELDGQSNYSSIQKIVVNTGSNFVKIAPNPTASDINLFLPATQNRSLKILLFDLMGKQIYQKALPIGSSGQLTIDMQEWATGMYILQIDDGKQIQIDRVIKK